MATPPGHAPLNRYPPPNDTVLVFVLLAGVAIGGTWFLWVRYHAEIAPVVVQIERWQMALLAYVTDRYRGLDAQVAAMDPASLTARELFQLCHFVGLSFRIPAALFVGGLAALCLTRSASARFTSSLDVDRLTRVQAKVFRPLAVIAHRRLKPVPAPEGAPRPLDPALHPVEWIRLFATDRTGAFDDAQARAELVAQLGELWRGPERAAPIVRCLFAAFALHAMRQRDRARDLLGAVAESLGSADGEGPEGPRAPLAVPAPVVARADSVLGERTVIAFSKKVAARHGFAATALMGVLWEARRRAGVLAPAEFLVTKLVDRRLWYALHGLGFPAETEALDTPPPNPRIEAMGALAHWLAERRSGHPLLLPEIEQAVLSVRAHHAKAEATSSREKVETP